MTATYARDGRPYDPQLLRDLPHSGAPDLATLAVSDALASALTLLILIPLTALASGALGARLPRTADPTGTSAPPHPHLEPEPPRRARPIHAGDRTCAVTRTRPNPRVLRHLARDDIVVLTTEPSRSGPRTSSPRRARELLTIDWDDAEQSDGHGGGGASHGNGQRGRNCSDRREERDS